MENTVENRQKFLALYWGQEGILMQQDLGHHGLDNFPRGWWYDKGQLELKSMTLLSDEDILELSKISLKNAFNFYNLENPVVYRRIYDLTEGSDAEESVNIIFDARVKNSDLEASGWKDCKIWLNIVIKNPFDSDSLILAYRKDIGENSWSFYNTANTQSYSYDYLRSRGYALPWMGLSVEKQVEYGWVRLIGEKL